MRFFLVACLLFLVPTMTLANRVALVIGNSAYENVDPLANPRNDAIAIAASLEKQGFEIVTAYDMSRREMLDTLRAFRNRADQAEFAMVYYAGHGMEIAGRNYLIPVDARIADERDARLEMIQLDDVLVQMSGAKRMKMLVLDACRDNPFVARMKREQTGRNVGRGLAIVNAADADTLIAYAAAAGEVTPDGLAGGNSPFTTAFLAALDSPPSDIRLLLGKVRDQMRETVPGAAPFVYSSLGGGEYVINPNSRGGQPRTTTQSAQLDENSLLRDFATAEFSGSVETWDAFLAKYSGFSSHTLYLLGQRKRDLLSRARPSVNNGVASNSRASQGETGQQQPETVASLVPQVFEPVRPAAEPARAEPSVTATPDPEPAMTRKEAMTEIQRQLKQRNCYAGRLDGIYGRGTAGGLQALSRETGLQLSIDKASLPEEMMRLIDQLTGIEGATCPQVAVKRKRPTTTTKSTTTQRKTTTTQTAPKTATTTAPAPEKPKKRRQKPCPVFGNFDGCVDGVRVKDKADGW